MLYIWYTSWKIIKPINQVNKLQISVQITKNQLRQSIVLCTAQYNFCRLGIWYIPFYAFDFEVKHIAYDQWIDRMP